MLHISPLVLLPPLQVALAFIGLLAYLGIRYTDRLSAYRSATPRHRLTPALAADPNRRDWATIAAERINAALSPPVVEEIEYDPLDPRISLAEVERRMALLDLRPALVTICGGQAVALAPGDTVDWRVEYSIDGVVVAGHDDHPMPADDDTRELEMVR